MQHGPYTDVEKRLNCGAPVAAVDPAYLKRYWEVFQSMPPERRHHGMAVGLGALAGAENEPPDLTEDQIAGLLLRLALQNALFERGLLQDHLDDEAKREKLFRALATVPCNNQDLIEAISPRILRDAKPEAARKFRQEMAGAHRDPEHPRIVRELRSWLTGENE